MPAQNAGESAYVGEDPRGRDQRVRITWSVPAGGDVDASRMFDPQRRRRQTTREWLVNYLREHGPSLREDVIAAARREDERVGQENTGEVPNRVRWYLIEDRAGEGDDS